MTIVNNKNNKKGFTLVELVVVIAILAILATVAIPIVSLIVNNASKNLALSNAHTIELAVKECQSYIVIKNDEVYNGKQINGVNIPKASTNGNSITVEHVATAKAISKAFNPVTCRGVSYSPYWDTLEEKCVFIGGVIDNSGNSVYQDINENTITGTVGMSLGSRYIALSTTVSGVTIINNSIKIKML